MYLCSISHSICSLINFLEGRNIFLRISTNSVCKYNVKTKKEAINVSNDLELGIGNSFPHFQDLYDCLLCSEYSQLQYSLVLLFSRFLRGQLQSSDQIYSPSSLHLIILHECKILTIEMCNLTLKTLSNL